MKHINITYHMEKPGEVVESAATLPMNDHFAELVLRWGPENIPEIECILRMMAEIQGYTYCGACCPEEV